MLSPFGDEEIDVQMDKGQERWLLYVTGRKIRAMSHEQFPNRSSKGPGIFTGKCISAWCKKIYLTTICICIHTHIYVCIHIGGRYTTTNIGVDIEVCIYRDRQGKMKIMKKQSGRNRASYMVHKTPRITPRLKGMKREIKITLYLQYHW